MIRIPDTPLDPATASALAGFQADLDTVPRYADRVIEADKRFASRNRERDKTFRVVRRTLTEMCSGAKRCMYCEDSVADEVEHVRPKHLYPEATFVWENYVYACGPCNGGKRNRFEVHDTAGTRHDVTRRPGDPIVKPIPGEPLLIDPRSQNPFDFLQLDLRGTFLFVPVPGLSARDRARAEFSCELLKLNDRDYLVRARKGAFAGLLSHLRAYSDLRTDAPRSPRLKRIRAAIAETDHPTVWAEMKRQRAKINELRVLFRAVPEALNW